LKKPLENRLSDQELEDKIWEYTKEERRKGKIWSKVGGDKKRCFDKIESMVQASILKVIDDGKHKFYVRIDTINQEEFIGAFEFQKRMLESSRSKIKKIKKPMFKKIGIYKTSRWSDGLRKSVQDIDKKGEFKPRSNEVKKNFDDMEFYHGALMQIISQTNLQRSLGLIMESIAETRIEKCQNALDDHFEKLLSENPRNSNAIRQYFKHKRFEMRDFRIS